MAKDWQEIIEEKKFNNYENIKLYDYKEEIKLPDYSYKKGTPTDREFYFLQGKLGEAMHEFHQAILKGDVDLMQQAFIKANKIQDNIKDLTRIQMAERGLCYKSKSGHECYSLEELQYWDDLYNQTMHETNDEVGKTK